MIPEQTNCKTPGHGIPLGYVQEFEFIVISIKFDRNCTYGYTGHHLLQVS